ncbi:MAG: esterase/lipase family protein, partial [Gemmatimonadota bacterium]
MPKATMRDVVVLLPGIMGSVLQRNGKDAWAISGQAITRALLSLGDSIAGLELGADDPGLDDLGDGVLPTRVLPDAHLVPGFIRIDGYSHLLDMMLSGFDLAEGAFSEPRPGRIALSRPGNFFQFPYDWRRDNRVAARRLKRLVDLALAEQRKRAPDAKVILLGHGMGGLVSRYY